MTGPRQEPSPHRRPGRPSTAAEQLLAVESLRRRLVKASTELEASPWYARRRRHANRVAVDRLVDAERRAVAALPADAPQQVAIELIDNHWKALRSEVTTRYPYHPEALQDLVVTSVAVATAIARDGHASATGRRPIPLADLPSSVAEFCSADDVARYVSAEISRRAAVADDPGFVFRRTDDELVVQHRASGLRARMCLPQQGDVGKVYSKAHSIPSIDPNGHGDAWEQYRGLGIGRRLYAAGAAKLPHLRWASSTASREASGVRRYLHSLDPHRWQADCAWCTARSNQSSYSGWAQWSEQDFEQHP